jgi:hypothetical protein
MMDIEKLAGLYERLDSARKSVFLACIAERLTVCGRDAYGPSNTVASPDLLRVINEIQHQVLGQLRAVCERTPGYPSDVFVAEIISIAKTGNCLYVLEFAIGGCPLSDSLA